MFDETSDRRKLKLCNIIDEYTLKALAIRADRMCTAEDIVLTRGAPEYLRADMTPLGSPVLSGGGVKDDLWSRGLVATDYGCRSLGIR